MKIFPRVITHTHTSTNILLIFNISSSKRRQITATIKFSTTGYIHSPIDNDKALNMRHINQQKKKLSTFNEIIASFYMSHERHHHGIILLTTLLLYKYLVLLHAWDESTVEVEEEVILKCIYSLRCCMSSIRIKVFICLNFTTFLYCLNVHFYVDRSKKEIIDKNREEGRWMGKILQLRRKW